MDALIAFLKKDEVYNSDLLHIIHRGTADVIYFDGSNFLICDRISNIYYISAKDIQIAEEIFSAVDNIPIISAREEFYADLIFEKYSLRPTLKAYTASYRKGKPVQIEYNGFEIRPLDDSYTFIIHENYHAVNDIDYIKGRLKEGMYGAFKGCELAGFAGKHEEGCFGLLYVFPKFRRMGVASLLSAVYINRCLESKEIPFSQITVDNKASYAMHKKFGFDISDKTVRFFER